MGNKDIFGVETNYQNENFLPVSQLSITISGNESNESVDLGPFLVQNVQWNYSRQIQQVKSIGNTEINQVKQPAQGQMTIGRLCSKTPIKPVIQRLSENINNNNVITLKPVNNTTVSAYEYSFHNPAVSSIGVQVDANSGFVQESLAFTFSCLED